MKQKIPCNIRVPNKDNSDYVVRHHYREILSPCFPDKEGSDAIDVETTFAHINEL